MSRGKVFQLLIVTMFGFQVNGDVIMPMHHLIDRCAAVSNVSQFPDIVLFAAYKPAMSSQSMERYVIEENSCLTKGYKFCALHIFWAEKTYFDSIGLSNLSIEEFVDVRTDSIKIPNTISKPFSIIPVSIEPYGDQVPDSIQSVKENLGYKLMPTASANAYTLYLVSKTTYYKNGTDTVIQYPYDVSIRRDKKGSGKQFEVVKVAFGQGCLLVSSLYTGKINAQLIDCRGCIVNRFTRMLEADKYYTIPCGGVTTGMYWLHVKSIGREDTFPLRLLGD